MLNKKQITSILGQLFFWGFAVFGLGIIYCLKESYTAPLLFLGLINTPNELNMKVFSVLISVSFLALLVEILFIFSYVSLLKKIKYDHVISIFIMLLMLKSQRLGLSSTDSLVIFLICSLWFYLRLFTLDTRNKDFERTMIGYIKHDEPNFIKSRRDDQVRMFCTFIIAFISVFILVNSEVEPNSDKVLLLFMKMLTVLVMCIFLVLYARQSNKYRYTPKQTISFIGSYDELVDKLFQYGFIFDKHIENYISFYHKTLFLPNQTILVREEANQYSITGQETIIKDLEKDLNNKGLKEVKTSNVLGLLEC